jgi:hypothetical protein
MIKNVLLGALVGLFGLPFIVYILSLMASGIRAVVLGYMACLWAPFLGLIIGAIVGAIMRKSGTDITRKLRWAISGRGKSGGIRVIYYWKSREDEI